MEPNCFNRNTDFKVGNFKEKKFPSIPGLQPGFSALSVGTLLTELPRWTPEPSENVSSDVILSVC